MISSARYSARTRRATPVTSNEHNMFDLLKVVLGAITATTVFVLGQVAVKFFIEPIQEQRRTIGRIIDDLGYYANVYLSADYAAEDTKRECRERLRRRSSELRAATQAIPWYARWERLGVVR